ncbi:MAG TPA: hypothetical protein VNL92_05910 [Dehalococcoidia bacterium]|nr:hypothetical protein [Dehalococcoidia bacterium]
MSSSRRAVFAAFAASWIAIVGGVPRITQADPAVHPNGAYGPGANAIVVEGGGTPGDIAKVVAEDSRMRVDALWLLIGGKWLFYLPQAPLVEGGLQTFPPNA